MANDIATHAVARLQKFSESLQRLYFLQDLETDNTHLEGAESAWMLRAEFLDRVKQEWEEIFLLMRQEILPLVNDIKVMGVRHD